MLRTCQLISIASRARTLCVLTALAGVHGVQDPAIESDPLEGWAEVTDAADAQPAADDVDVWASKPVCSASMRRGIPRDTFA